MKSVFVLLLVLGSIAAGVAYYVTQAAAEPPASFRTATVTRGNLLSTISATGTVEPEEVVDVGAQVAGRVLSLGTDEKQATGEQLKRIDYGSAVEDGTVLALIDPAVYKAQADQANASLVRAEADLLQARAKQEQAEAEWKRAQRLRPDLAAANSEHALTGTALVSAANTPVRKVISDTDYVLAKANCSSAQANTAVAEAAIQQAKAVAKMAETNLGYTVIKSPVKGVIIDRRVNIGQTVVASLNAPSLFLIAKDLAKMQVWASVNEADIGRIRTDMSVRFTVDAYPGETFRGKVAQVRLNATMTQNVVTYTVVVSTENSDLRLLPYLTASLQFEVEEHKDVLLVPNAALRWRPRPQLMASDVREKLASTSSGRGGRGGGPEDRFSAKGAGTPQAGKVEKPREDRARLWIKDGGFVRPIDVQIGVTDGSMTEVRGDRVTDGLEVVLAEVRNDTGGGDTTNPFAPKLFRGRPKSQP